MKRMNRLNRGILIVVALVSALLPASCSTKGSVVSDVEITAFYATATCQERAWNRDFLRLRFLRDEASYVGCGATFDAYFHCLVANGTCEFDACPTEREGIDDCASDPKSVCNLAQAHRAQCEGSVTFHEVPLCGHFSECAYQCMLDATCQEIEQGTRVWVCQSECVVEEWSE